MAINPLEERKISYDEAVQSGYVLPGYTYSSTVGGASNIVPFSQYIQSRATSPQTETWWNNIFDLQLADADKFIADAPYTIGTYYNAAVASKNLAPTYIQKRAEQIKQLTQQELSSRAKELVSQRKARATGGLLASSAAPSLSEQGKGGIPDLGVSGPNLGVTQQLGTKAKR